MRFPNWSALAHGLSVALVLWCSLIVWCSLIAWCSSGVAAANDLTASIGIEGHYRTGRWTPLRIEGLAEGHTPVVRSVDGDGVRLTHSVDPARVTDGIAVTYLPAGSPGAQVSVTVVDPAGQPVPGAVWQTRLIDGAVDPMRPWVVALGDALGLDQVGQNQLLGVSGSMDVSTVVDARRLPDAWIGYDGVDLLVLSGSSIDLLREASPTQITAIQDWVQGGGRMLVTLGARGPDLIEAAPWLRPRIGLEEDGPAPRVVQAEPGAIETFISSRDPLTGFPATQVTGDLGAIFLSGFTSNRQPLPLAWRQGWGFGWVTVFAGGLDQGPAAEWSQRTQLLDRILPGLFPSRQQRDEIRRRGDLRYSELAGQLRATLDQFAGAGSGRFSLIAAVILALVGLIGPLDYLLVNRWLGRPLLGWVTFPVSIVAFSAAIILWRGDEQQSQVRQITVVDVDPQLGVGRGFSWAQVFSARADRLDLRIAADSPWSESASREGGESGGFEGQTLTGPWGFAGEVFGGIEVAGEDVRLPAYELVLEEQEAGENTELVSSLREVPFAPLSSKGVVARWQFPVTRQAQSQLQRRFSSDLLSGSFTNPLGVDLIDGYLVYRNLVYVLPTRVPAGGQIAAVEVLQAKNFRWRLNRRQTVEFASASEPWDPADDVHLDRLMEMILFYQAAGGANYVGLANRTLAPLDLSGLLDADRAILVGRTGRPGAMVHKDGEAVEASAVEQHTYVRVILPVETAQREREQRP